MKVYSTDEENFRHESIEEAIEGLECCLDLNAELTAGSLLTIWEGTARKHKASEFIPDMIEQLEEGAYDECGEWTDEWPNSTPDQDHELRDSVKVAVDAWADKYNLQPRFYTVDDPEEIRLHVVEKDDVLGIEVV